MGDNFKKVQTGDKLRIPAAAYNAFIDSALDLRARQQNQGQTPQAAYRTSGIVLVKNASGSDQDRFAVLGVERPIYTPEDNLDSYKNKVALVGVTPTEPDHYGNFVVLLEPLKAGSIGMAYGNGVCPVRVHVPEGAEDFRFADVREGKTVLVAAHAGSAEILWKDDASGSSSGENWVWATARIGPPAMPACMLGVVVCKGPDGEPEPTGNRYWVQESTVRYSDGVFFEPIDEGRIVEATNLFEPPEMHNVGKGEPVMLFSGWDAGGEVRYWMIAAREGGPPCGSSSSSGSSESDSSSSGSSSDSSSSASDSGGSSSGSSDSQSSDSSSSGSESSGSSGSSDSQSSGSNSSGSQSSGSGSDSSGSGSGSGSGDSSSSGSSGSGSSSESSSSGSGSGSGSGSDSDGSSSGSDKSTAIVPARFSPTGYAALFTLETPEVRFDDVLDMTIRQRNQSVVIDPRYLAVCDPGSVRVCGVSCDQPIAVGASVVGNCVQLRFSRSARRTLNVVIRLTGIRKGFSGRRFPARRHDQFLANERFINSAYPR